MRRSISKAILAAFVASAAALFFVSPSSAFGTFHGGGFHGGGFHGGMGGFHGGMGGFHGGFGGFHPGPGGFHPGFRHGFVGFHPGFRRFAGRRFFFHHGFHNHVFIGTAVVAGPWWWGGYSGYDGCWSYRPVYDAAGAYLGYNYVNLCY